jgi:zinc/manganese transport system permease protein
VGGFSLPASLPNCRSGSDREEFLCLIGLIILFLKCTTFVQIGGVLLVFSYLIVPAVCGKFLAESLTARLMIGWLVATVGSVVGLWASYVGDWPTGAAIVCALGVALLMCGGGVALKRRS